MFFTTYDCLGRNTWVIVNGLQMQKDLVVAGSIIRLIASDNLANSWKIKKILTECGLFVLHV